MSDVITIAAGLLVTAAVAKAVGGPHHKCPTGYYYDETIGKCVQYVPPPPPPDPTPTPSPSPNTITVTPQNYQSMLQNIGSVDFTGSNSSYVQINKNHNILELPCTFQNFEIEAKVFVVSSTSTYKVQLYGGGGHHSVSIPCDGCKYSGRFGTTASTIVKEIHHTENPNGYTSNRITSSASYTSLIGRWAVLKVRSYNSSLVNNRTSRRIENYVDGVAKGYTIDSGGWSCQQTTNTEATTCPPREFGNTGYRKNDEILNEPGWLVSMRSDDDTIYRFEYFKVTEITFP